MSLKDFGLLNLLLSFNYEFAINVLYTFNLEMTIYIERELLWE